MLATTYGVGELSAMNGVMGAKAERSLVFHVVGMPSYQHQRVHKITHHTLGDGVFGNFVHLSGDAACCHAVINPENCVVEMERVIAEARRDNRPAYIAVPSDYALAPVVPADVKPIELRSNEAALQKAMAVIAERINKAKSVVALPAFTVLRLGLQKKCKRRSKRWAVRSPQRSWKSASSARATRSLPACMPAPRRIRKRGNSSKAPISCSIWAASI